MVAKKSFANSTPNSFGGKIGFSGLRERWEYNSERSEGIGLPETDWDSGENSLRSSSIPRTSIRNVYTERTYQKMLHS